MDERFIKISGQKVRAVIRRKKVWLCARDVCKAIEFLDGKKKNTNACKAKDLIKIDMPTSKGKRPMVYMNSDGLHSMFVASLNIMFDKKVKLCAMAKQLDKEVAAGKRRLWEWQ